MGMVRVIDRYVAMQYIGEDQGRGAISYIRPLDTLGRRRSRCLPTMTVSIARGQGFAIDLIVNVARHPAYNRGQSICCE